jgi:peptide/nickel transport system permease protein
LLAYALKRIANAIFVSLLLVTGIFLLLRIAPGGPVASILGEQATPEAIKQLTDQLGLDKPLAQQYIDYLGGILRGDLGTSVLTGQPVTDQLLQAFSASVDLALAAIVITIVVGVPIGILMAVHRGRLLDKALGSVLMLGVSAPPFWLGAMSIIVFSVKLGWFPTSGFSMGLLDMAQAIWYGEWSSVFQALQYYVLPAFTLAALELSFLGRTLRESVITELDQDYVSAAMARGLSVRRILGDHVLRNALLPSLTMTGMRLAGLMGGAVVVETIFAWPGLGLQLYHAISSRDYPMAQGAVLLLGLLVIFANLVVDLLYPLVNPQVRLAQKKGS